MEQIPDPKLHYTRFFIINLMEMVSETISEINEVG